MMQTLEQAIEVARKSIPIQKMIARHPVGYLITFDGKNHRVWKDEPQAPGGFLPPSQPVGKPVGKVSLKGVFEAV